MAGPIPGILQAAQDPLVNTQLLEQQKSFRGRQEAAARATQNVSAPRSIGRSIGKALGSKFGKETSEEKTAAGVSRAQARARSVFNSTPQALRDKQPFGEAIQRAGILVQELEAGGMPAAADKIRAQILALNEQQQQFRKLEGANAKQAEEVKQARIETAARMRDKAATDKEIRWLNELESIDTSTPEGKARFDVVTHLLEKAAAITGTTEFDPGADSITLRKVTDSLTNTVGILDGFQDLDTQFRPEFLQAPEKFKNWGANLLEIGGFGFSPEVTKNLEDFSVFRQVASKNVNAYIKFITGAQMNKDEVPRLMGDVPNTKTDGPTVFKAKLGKTIRNMGALRARSLAAVAAGVDNAEFHRIMATPFEEFMDPETDETATSGGPTMQQRLDAIHARQEARAAQ